MLAQKIESGDPEAGIERARQVNRRWIEQSPSRLHDEWSAILSGDWTTIRSALVEESERGARLRQNNPFCGILTPQERWAFFRKHRRHEA